MLKKVTFSLIFLMTITLFSQEKIGTDFKYKVTYNLTYSLESKNIENKKSEYMVLFLGDGISSYSSRAKLAGNTVVLKGNTAHTSKTSLTDFQYIIVKDFRQDFLAYTLQIVDDFFIINKG